MLVDNVILHDDRWHLDVDSDSPFYGSHPGNPQEPQFAFTQIYDRPAITPFFNPANAVWGLYQFFETCAICTDGGPGKYRIIGCVSWGHHVGGIGQSTHWGNGTSLRPVPPSQDFLRLFPSELLGN